jgi:Mg2+ and Co2+ transporter CorA
VINPVSAGRRVSLVSSDPQPVDPHGPDREDGLLIRLFDADRTDRILAFDDALKAKPSERQLLWIDIDGDIESEQRRALVERFDFDKETEQALAGTVARPDLQLHGKHFHLRVAAEPDAEHPQRISWLDIVAAPNLVISSHANSLQFVAAMDERIAADATIGELDSAEFVASMLDAVVTSYHTAIDRIEDELDDFDAKALGRPGTSELFKRLVGIRRRIGRLRRLLAAHREVFGSLGRRDFGHGISSADPDVFLPVTSRFEGALASLESTRDVVLGSFDILMTRTAQRTNDVMRVLTLATVMALPATITAGFLGMNVIVPVPNENPASFWIILGAVLLFEAAVFAIARWRGWL